MRTQQEQSDHDSIIKVEQKLAEHTTLLEYHSRAITSVLAAIFTSIGLVLLIIYQFVLPPIQAKSDQINAVNSSIMNKLDDLDRRVAVFGEQASRLYQTIDGLTDRIDGKRR